VDPMKEEKEWCSVDLTASEEGEWCGVDPNVYTSATATM
jgi:hypothetical protein